MLATVSLINIAPIQQSIACKTSLSDHALLACSRASVSVNNDPNVNSNIYFCMRTAASGFAMGVGYLGGACNKNALYRSAIQEWQNNDVYTARVINWLYHSTLIVMDFC